jgi:hypothetical protein
LPYQNPIRWITILSYLPLVYKYKLFDYKDKHDTSNFMRSPFMIAFYLIIIGMGMNQIAIISNGFKMPIFPTLTYFTGYAGTFIDSKHILGNMNTNMILFCDIFDCGYMCFSIGDILFRFFSAIMIYNSVKNFSLYC